MTSHIQSARFERARAAIDRLNAADPRQEICDGAARPREVVYAERLSACLARVYPQASEVLQLAARAQHVCRWQITRDTYPLGREGYNAWRTACRDHHAALATGVMRDCGYPEPDIAQVVKIIRKVDLKRDPESQALENVVGVVFVEHYLEAFVAAHAGYDEGKLLGILRKTMRKMDPVGHKAVRLQNLTEPCQRLVVASLADLPP